jgi:hypothetical protein
MEKAGLLWEDAPWRLLGDHEIVQVELNRWDLESVYACVMGMLGMEYGILLYRSLDSLCQFRQRVLANESMEHMEEAFLAQDCLFLTYDTTEPANPANRSRCLTGKGGKLSVLPMFGTLHPLEGVRSFLYEEEALAVTVILEALHRFFRQHHAQINGEDFPALTSRYKITPPIGDIAQPISVKVSTLPDLAEDLLEMAGPDDDDEAVNFPVIRDDLIPENAFLSLGMMPWDILEQTRSKVGHYQPGEAVKAGDGLPVVLVQTSRPKAKALIERLVAAGGLQGICFNPGSDALLGDEYDLGLLQVENGELCLFGEFGARDAQHLDARKKWDQRCRKTKGYCGFVVAMGMTGASRGNPKLSDMLALFEVRSISADELGLGVLERQPIPDWL